MINGILIDITADELKTSLLERATHHKAKVAFYTQQVANLQSEGVRPSAHVTNDPVRSLEQSAEAHKGRYAFFAFLAEHLVPAEVYRISENDLTRLELLSKYL